MTNQLAFAPRGQLWFGDNLTVLRRHVEAESVDLVYLDPPFKSNKSYNVLFKHRDGRLPAAQLKAFDDTWRWDMGAAKAYEEVVDGGGDVARALFAFRDLLGTTDMLAYLTMMAPRLVELRRVLKPTGTIYLHCDSTASAHLRLLMDAVFGHNNFLNEIIWHYKTSSGAPKKWLHRNHDTILRYAAQSPNDVTWHHPREPWPEETLKKWQKDEQGRIYRVQNKFNKRYYIDPAGKLGDDVWEITLASRSHERTGFQTQKPQELLERIILASSNEDDLILDPFCGCGTTVHAAQQLKRRWLGIDITSAAMEVIEDRLQRHFGVIDCVRRGEPTTVDEAFALAKLDKHAFQRWVCEQICAEPGGKGADRGIDGVLRGTFDDRTRWKAIVSVKGGGVTVSQLRDLRGTIAREKADMGLLVALRTATAAMKREAAEAGFGVGGAPVLQFLTVEEILNGRQPIYPDDVRLPGRLRVVS